MQFKLWQLVQAHPEGMTRDALFHRLYGHRADGGPYSLNIISVHISLINRRIKPLGVKITASCRGPISARYHIEAIPS